MREWFSYFVDLQVVKEDGIGFLELGQEWVGDLSHVGMGRRWGTHLEEVAPLTGIGSHDHFSLDAVREDRARFLWGRAVLNHLEVRFLGVVHGIGPHIVLGAAALPEGRTDKGDLVAVFILAVVAVASAFLAVRRQAVTHNLVRNAAVADEANGNRAVLNYCLMAALENVGNELLTALVRNQVLGLVAGAACNFDLLQQIQAVRACNDMGRWLNYSHYYSSSSVGHWPA